jgi:hypothetical protein
VKSEGLTRTAVFVDLDRGRVSLELTLYNLLVKFTPWADGRVLRISGLPEKDVLAVYSHPKLAELGKESALAPPRAPPSSKK